MAQKKPASRSGAKKKKARHRRQAGCGAGAGQNPRPANIGRGLLPSDGAGPFCLSGLSGLHPCRRKKPAGRTGGACGLLPVSGFVRISAGSAAVWQPSPGGVAQSGSLPVCGCSLCDCPFVWEAGGSTRWLCHGGSAVPHRRAEPVAASWGDSREFCLSWP